MMDDDQPPVPGLRLVVDNGRKPLPESRYARPPTALQTRMQAIADLIGVPTATFFDESSARALTEDPTADGLPTNGEIAELQILFGQVQDPRTRQDCLDFIRAHAGSAEP